jgi:hypothetical protein
VQTSWARLNDAQLSDANLEEAFLYDAYLRGAEATKKTTWPDGFEWRTEGVILVDRPGIRVRADDAATTAGAAGTGKRAESGEGNGAGRRERTT